jgi:ABC-2 type transport system permease protein
MRRINSLLKKDFKLFLSNRFYFLITVVGIVFYIVIYFVMPSQVDEELSLAMYAPELPPVFEQMADAEGLQLAMFNDSDSLQTAVMNGDYQMGIELPANILQTWTEGGQPDIRLYYASSTQPEMKDAVIEILEELSYAQTGQSLSFNTSQEILGPDLLGAQLSLRDRMRPMLAALILLVEVMTIAGLISTEIEQGTVRALLVTPMKTGDLFAAKGLIGIGMALGQAIIFMAIVGGFTQQPLLVLVTLLLGSLLVIGLAFLIASLTRDINSVTSWGLLVMIILMIPGIGSVIPGLLADWARVIPSFYLTDTINRVVNYGAGWQDVWVNLAILAVITCIAVWGGMAALRRRYQ